MLRDKNVQCFLAEFREMFEYHWSQADYYPKKRWKDDKIFAWRFFNKDNEEIAYYLPDLGRGIIFAKPMVWAREFLNKLGQAHWPKDCRWYY